MITRTTPVMKTEWERIEPDRQRRILLWINSNLVPTEKPIDKRSSYHLKMLIELDLGIALGSEAMKFAMLHSGFEAFDISERSWTFGMDQRRPDKTGFLEWLCSKKNRALRNPIGDLARDWYDDLTTACVECNAGKGGRTL